MDCFIEIFPQRPYQITVPFPAIPRGRIMNEAEQEIRTLVDAETTAWTARDASALAALFHPDTVWPWPPNSTAHDPMQWVMPLGRYNRERWIRSWQQLFDSHDLVHNHRRILRVAVSEEADGGFAVVDVDTLWRNRRTKEPLHWKGRACKVYTKVGGRWLFLFQTGLLEYKRCTQPLSAFGKIEPAD